MSTLTKEWLLKTIAELEEERDATPGAVNEDAAMALAAMKITLASLEAEAVVFRSKLKPPSAIGSESWDYTDHRQPDAFELENCVIERLYTAPPAPVSVPDAMDGHGGVCCEVSYADGWNSCLAAMLQGAEPVSNRDELPDGWVACSERMPEDEQEVITHNIFGYRHVSFFDEHSGHFFDRLDGSPVDCVEHVLVSHWMPLPAAPQQEVK
ncbi:DUF551 domain-containing protein [Enterobacter hormaechei]